MAQQKSTNKSAASSAKKKPASAAKPKKAASAPAPELEISIQPMRRETGAAILALLSLFLFISYFHMEGSFIVFFANLVKGLLGWGYFLCGPLFLWAAIVLAFHRGRPVALRTWCILLIPVLIASLGNLIAYHPGYVVFELKAATADLFAQGIELHSGGAIGGLCAMGLQSCLSAFGAVILLILMLFFCIVFAAELKLSSLYALLRAQVRTPYDPKKYERSAPETSEDMSFRPVRPLDLPIERESELQPVNPVRNVDIPLADEGEALPLFNADTKRRSEPKEEKTSAASAMPRRVKVRKSEPKAAESAASPTDRVASLPPEEAAKLAGADEDGFVHIPNPPSAPTSKSTVRTAEISDPPKGKKLSRSEVEEEAQVMAETIANESSTGDYVYPPLNLLRAGGAVHGDSRDEIARTRERLEGALHSFGISAGIVGVIRGPTVTRYDIELEQGVKLSRVTNLAGDIALSLGVMNVRIAPIPDKISTVGIEVPNKIVSTVYLRDILESPRFQTAKSRLSFALGKDIGGDCIVGNIAKLPHMLIAGTTGSGKSVCMNSLILSLLYKARPDEVRLIMIDPKMVELGVYNGIPHLYVPVVTDPKKAAGALQWSVVEMLKRYRLFSEVGVRDLETYNKGCEARGEMRMPQVVIVIDELADLMLVASKEVEESICRVAQMGRAAGMHLVIATQRPSADVITGLMKANIPSRIAFAVSSAMESRIILDAQGAEKLVGMGDMLYSPVGCGKPTRVQGAYVSDEERECVIDFIKESMGPSERNKEIEDFMNKALEDKKSSDSKKDDADMGGESGDFDEMLPQCVEAVLEAKACSVSMLQRRVKLGYSRAARIVDQMEELGVVGPYQGSKPRDVIIDRAGWQELQVSLGMAAKDDFSLAAEMSEEADYDIG